MPLLPVDVFTFNCNGLGKAAKLNMILTKALKTKTNESFVIHLQETKIKSLCKSSQKVLDYHNCDSYTKPCEGHYGGLITIWSRNLSLKNIISESDSHIDLVLCYNDSPFRSINVYLSPTIFYRKASQVCDSVCTTNATPTMPILFAGDLNSFEDINLDYKGMNKRCDDKRLARYNKLRSIITHLKLTPAKPQNNMNRFTHYCKKQKSFSRIDHVFTNLEHEICCYTIPLSNSDHRMLHANCSNLITDRGPGYWKLNEEVLTDNRKSVLDLFTEFLNAGNVNYERYEQLKLKLRETLNFLNVNLNRIKTYRKAYLTKRKRIVEEQINSNSNLPRDIFMRYEELDKKIKTIEGKETYNKYKFLANLFLEVNEGDSKALKDFKKKKLKGNGILSLHDNLNNVITDSAEILQVFEDQYQQLYRSNPSPGENHNPILSKFVEQLPSSYKRKAQRLSKPILPSEVEAAIRKLNGKSSPGPDGLTANLYKLFKEQYSAILSDLFNNAREGDLLPHSFKDAIIKLIPKSTQANRVTDYRPISLINTDQKILSHVVSTRLQPLLRKIIGPHQRAYLENRSMHQGILNARINLEAIRENSTIVSLDFSKAFDRLDRSYIFKLLQAIHVPNSLISLIKESNTDLTSIIEVNGFLGNRIEIQRGVRQGCPLSALLFILGIEPLLRNLQESPYVKSKFQTKVSAYADDVVLFIKHDSIETALDYVNEFCEQTQLEINTAKTTIVSKRKIRNEFQTTKSFKYLGVLLSTANEQCSFNAIKEELEKDQLVLRPLSLRGKSLSIETFWTPKVLHTARHIDITNECINKLQLLMYTKFWSNLKRPELSKAVLHNSPNNGGVGLPYLHAKITTAKLLDLTKANNNESEVIKRWKDSSLHKCLNRMLRHYKLTLVLENDRVFVKKNGRKRLITPAAVFRDIYSELIEIKFPKILVEDRLRRSELKYDISAKLLIALTPKIWSSHQLTPMEKNLCYRLIFNNFKDKYQLFNMGYRDSSKCDFCPEPHQTIEHLIFKCNGTQPLREQILDFSDWKTTFNSWNDTKAKQLAKGIFLTFNQNSNSFLVKYLNSNCPQ